MFIDRIFHLVCVAIVMTKKRISEEDVCSFGSEKVGSGAGLCWQLSDEKKNINQRHSCPRDWPLSA